MSDLTTSPSSSVPGVELPYNASKVVDGMQFIDLLIAVQNEVERMEKNRLVSVYSPNNKQFWADQLDRVTPLLEMLVHANQRMGFIEVKWWDQHTFADSLGLPPQEDTDAS